MTARKRTFLAVEWLKNGRQVSVRLAMRLAKPRHLLHLETFAMILISVIPLVGISLATCIAVHAGNGALI
jgi:hypothetical protein